jgi:hypothetical protein
MALRSSPLLRQNAIVRALLGGNTKDCYIPLATSFTYENILAEAMEWEGVEYHALYSNVYLENEAGINDGRIDPNELKAPDSSVTFTTTAQSDGLVYFYIETAFQVELEMFVNGERYGILYGNEDDFVKGLGEYAAGDEITVKLRMKDSCYFHFPTDTVAFYQEDAEAAIEQLTALGQNGLTLSAFTEDSFAGSITTTEERPYVQTTIPYDAGWIVTVDGVRTAVFETVDALLAFETTPGEHTIEMIYRPTCYVLGKTVSIVGVAIFLVLILIEEIWKRGVWQPAEGGVAYRLLDLFFCKERLADEPNYLSDEEMQRAEDARRPRIPHEDESDPQEHESEDEGVNG